MPEVDFAHPLGSRQFTDGEKGFLYDLAYPSKVVCEVGSWVGDSTEALGRCVRECDGVLYCVDSFQGNPETALVGKTQEHDIFSIFRDNMTKLDLMRYIQVLYMTSAHAVELVPDEFFEFIFIDANHTYDYVKHDITNWIDKVAPGGILAGHDYEDCEFEEEHIHKDFVHNKHNGLIKAVNEFFGKENVGKGAGTLWWIQK